LIGLFLFHYNIPQKKKEKNKKKRKKKAIEKAGQGVLSRFLTFYLIQ
jgi:hypothetical protein